MMYYTIRGFSGEFYGQFEDREEAEAYARREIVGGWDVVMVDHEFILKCLIDVLASYCGDNDTVIRNSVKATLGQLKSIWGLERTSTIDPTEDPLFLPVYDFEVADNGQNVQREADQIALAKWQEAVNSR